MSAAPKKKDPVAERLAALTGLSAEEAKAQQTPAWDPNVSNVHNLLKNVVGLFVGPAAGDLGELGALVNGKPFAPTAPKPAAAAPGVDPNNLFDVPAAGSAGAAPGGFDMNSLLSRALSGSGTAGGAPDFGPLDIIGSIPGAKITSTTRTPEHNAAVGGVSNSQHIGGTAVDFVAPKGMSLDAVKKIFADSGIPLTEALDEKDHFHLAWGPKNGQPGFTGVPGSVQVQPSAAAPFTQPALSYADPTMLAGMIPDPKQIPHITMPTAPHQAAPPPVSPYEQLDVNALLKPLQDAMQPVAHAAPTKQELLSQILSGISHGMSGMDPEAGLGDLLLGAGTGYSDTKVQQGKDARALTEKEAEDKRQVATLLAQMGLGMNEQNVGTRNTNLDRTRTGELAGQTVQFGNDTNDFNTQLQGLLANAGIDEKNIGAQNATANNRAETRINATQAGVTTSNAAQMGAANNSTGLATALINANGGLAGGLMNPHLSSVFSSANLDPTTLKASKDPLDQNAYEAGTYLAQGNVPLALGNLATEMLANTDLTSLGDSVQKQVKSVLQKAGTGADNQQRAQQTAAGIISQYLNTLNNDPEHRVLLGQLIDELAKTGTNKTAMILAGKMKRGQAAGPAPAK